MFCVNCGKKIDDGIGRCPYCGKEDTRYSQLIQSIGIQTKWAGDVYTGI